MPDAPKIALLGLRPECSTSLADNPPGTSPPYPNRVPLAVLSCLRSKLANQVASPLKVVAEALEVEFSR